MQPEGFEDSFCTLLKQQMQEIELKSHPLPKNAVFLELDQSLSTLPLFFSGAKFRIPTA